MSVFLKQKTINLEIAGSCPLKCPACFRQDSRFQKVRNKLENLSLRDFEKIADWFQEIIFCGNMSDPTVHPDFVKMLEQLNIRNVVTHVANAASHRSLEWYKDAFSANPAAFWVFGIDGLPQSSHRYRINQDGEKLFSVMCEARKMGMNVLWQFFIFNYNESEISAALKLAQDNGLPIKILKTKRHGSGLAPESSFIHHWDQSEGQKKNIEPRCFKARALGHSAQGYILPCPWFGSADVTEAYPDLCNEHTKISNVDSIEEIFSHPAWLNLEKKLKVSSPHAPEVCWYNCQQGKLGSFVTLEEYTPIDVFGLDQADA